MIGATVAIVPIRSLRDGKTRLAPVLSPGRREALVRRLLGDTIGTVLQSGAVDGLLVISPDADALDLAAAADQRVEAVVQAPERPGLNGAVAQARSLAIDTGASRLLVVFGDLPILTPAEVRSVAEADTDVAIGLDRHGAGTNALLVRLDGDGARFAFAFGEGSAARHLAEARRLGLSAATIDLPGTAFDLDEPDDWSELGCRFRDVAARLVPDRAAQLVGIGCEDDR